MRRRISLELSEFGRDAIERGALRLGVSPDQLVREALMYYLSDLGSGRRAARPPPPGCQPLALSVEVDVDAGTWEELDRAAVQFGVPPDRLTVHAALYYLADLESGRVARRIAGRLRR